MLKIILMDRRDTFVNIESSDEVLVVYPELLNDIPGLIAKLERYETFILKGDFEIINLTGEKRYYEIIKGFINNLILSRNLGKVSERRINRNVLSNALKFPFFPDISIVRRIRVDVPVIVVSNGPSLVNDIEAIRSLSDTFLIVAVSGAGKLLIRGRVVPDFVIYVDPSKKQYEAYKRGVNFTEETFVVLSIAVDPRFFREDERIVTFTPEDLRISVLPLVKECAPIPSEMKMGLSVSHAAFFLSIMMSKAPIILVGQDLAVADDGRMHAEGSKENDEKLLRNNLIEIEGANSKKLLTTWELFLFKRYFEEMGKYLKELGYTIFNATSRGVKLENFPHVSLDEPLIRKISKIYRDRKKYFKRVLNEIYYLEKSRRAAEYDRIGLKDCIDAIQTP